MEDVLVADKTTDPDIPFDPAPEPWDVDDEGVLYRRIDARR